MQIIGETSEEATSVDWRGVRADISDKLLTPVMLRAQICGHWREFLAYLLTRSAETAHMGKQGRSTAMHS
eukprot:11046359-Prorocentrum_lima.AAC.1